MEPREPTWGVFLSGVSERRHGGARRSSSIKIREKRKEKKRKRKEKNLNTCVSMYCVRSLKVTT